MLSRWLGVRPGELRRAALSFFGAFSVLSFLVLGRSLREAFYLTRFDVTTLPYVIGAVAVLSLPAVAVLSSLLAGRSPDVIYRSLVVLQGAGLLALWPLMEMSRWAAVAFYLWTALGTLLLTSSFWVVTAEHFTLREAKRLFGLISGGGTLGLMVTGTSLNWLPGMVGTTTLVVPLVGTLVALFLLQLAMPDPRRSPQEVLAEQDAEPVSLRRGLELVWESPHLRTVALVVFCATVASTMLDYQFKELVRAAYSADDELARYFGTFYGWTGVVAFLIQVLLVSRLLAVTGVAASLAVLPTMLLAGSAGLLLAPGLVLVTAVRGVDYSLRKSLHRSVIEYLFVPVPSLLRRKTKTFVDTVVDSVAEGCGAALVFLWVTFGGFPSRFLSVGVAVVAALFIGISIRMGRQYMTTLQERLREGGDALSQDLVRSRFDGRELLTATLTHLDLQQQLERAGIDGSQLGTGAGREERARGDREGEPEREGETSLSRRLASTDPMEVHGALDEGDDWGEEHVDALIRLLPRGPFYERASKILQEIGEPALERLVELLHDDATDFVVRRRIPRVLTGIDHPEADDALLEALSANRFEVRYRSAIALVRRRKQGLAEAPREAEPVIWEAIEREASRERPIWELQKLLDGAEAGTDDFVEERVGVRGELSLEHTFRLLSLVLDSELVRTAYHGVVLSDEELESVSLEYLEQVLPSRIRDKLWPFIGDVSDHQRQQAMRPVDEVAEDLLRTGATLFGDEEGREALREALRNRKERSSGERNGGERNGGERDGDERNGDEPNRDGRNRDERDRGGQGEMDPGERDEDEDPTEGSR